MKTKKIIGTLPDFFLAQLLSLSFVLALTTSLGLNYPHLKIYLMIFAATLIYSLAFTNRLSSVFAASLAGLAVLIAAYIIAFRTGIEKVAVFLDDYFYWLYDFIMNSGIPDRTYQLITVVALCAAVSLFTYLFTVKKFVFYVLLITGSAIFTVQWSYYLTTSLVPFYIFLPVILVLYFKHVHSWKSASTQNEYMNAGYYTLWIIPVCVAAVLLSASLHVNDNPLQWKWLDKKINTVYNYFNKKFNYEAFDYFSVSSSGFGGKDNLLGGRVRLNKTLVLNVETPHNVYLKGISRDVYTGTKWVNSSAEMQAIGGNYNSLYEDTEEMLLGMELLTNDPQALDKYFFKDTVNITFQNLRTKSLFIPSKTFAFSPANTDLKGITDVNGSLSVAERLNKGFKYSLQLYSPKLGSKEFADVLRKSKPGLYDEYALKIQTLSDTIFTPLPQVVSSDLANASSSNTVNATASYTLPYNYSRSLRLLPQLKELQENAKAVEAKYLQLPETLPQRVRDLAVSITASSGNRYDKVKAIEQYLSGNFPYNLDVRTTPRNRDFVDYFIFDLKQGYCTYYASAMAVLARCAGIPARYVEGYMLPPKPIEEGSKKYSVSNMQAHAWVEIYFEGYGWLPFEPTSPFRSSFYLDNSIQASYSGGYSSSYEDYMEMIRRYSQGGNSGGLDIQKEEETEKYSGLFIIAVCIGAAVVLLIVLIVFNLFRSKLRLYRIMNLPSRECILKLYDYFVRILSLQGLGIRGGETALQYSQRIDGFMFYSPVKFKAVTDIFVKCRYSLNDASEKEKQLVGDFRSSFMSETRSNIGKARFFFLKCILGKI